MLQTGLCKPFEAYLLCVVLENIPVGNSASLIAFISNLKDALKDTNRTLKLVLPAKDYANNFNILQLNKIVDQYIMMGYNYHEKGSKSGPVAPLEDHTNNLHLKASVKEYLDSGVPYNKLIVALPLYGIVLEKTGEGVDDYKFYEYWTYSEIRKDLSNSKRKIEYDPVKSINSYKFSKDGKEYFCYFDDAKSLEKKCKWLVNHGIAGVGVWTLGYDLGSKDFWNMISENFHVVKLPPVSKEINILNRIVLDTADSVLISNDTIYVLHSATRKDTIVLDTLLKSFFDGPVDTTSKPEEQSFLTKAYEAITDYFYPFLQNEIILAIIAGTLLIFGLLGIILSLLFGLVYYIYFLW